MRKRGFLVVISGPSGTGKNSVLELLRDEMPDLSYSVSATTRSMREGEVNSEHYYFMTREEFLMREANQEFIETAEFCGNLYGTLKSVIESKLSDGIDVIMDIETKGAKQVRLAFPDAVMVFLMPPSFDELRQRLLLRGKDSSEEIERRLAVAREEAYEVSHYSYVVVNNDLIAAAKEVSSIIRAERCRIERLSVDMFLGTLDSK